MYSLLLIRPGSLPLLPPHYSSDLSSSVAATAAVLAPAILMPAYSHHRIPTRYPGALFTPYAGLAVIA